MKSKDPECWSAVTNDVKDINKNNKSGSFNNNNKKDHNNNNQNAHANKSNGRSSRNSLSNISIDVYHSVRGSAGTGAGTGTGTGASDEKCKLKGFSQFANGSAKEKIFQDLSRRSNSYGSISFEYPSLQPTSVSDIIGSFGWFQFLVLLFSGLREAAVGYDAVVMSIILQPEEHFYCADRLESNFTIDPNRTLEAFNETAQCFQSVNGKFLIDQEFGKPIMCRSWIFPHLKEVSLVAEWSLVCHQHWLIAFIESAYFFGLVTGNLVWGYYADKVGRRKAYLVAHSIALVAGLTSIVVPNIELFAICRYFSAFGSIGYNIIYSIQVELIGAKHRSFSTILNHLGWGLGVIFVPLSDHLFHDYRAIIAVGPILTLIMYPWAFWLPESPRWLMSSDDFPGAERELLRAAKFNGKAIDGSLKKKIAMLKGKIKSDKLYDSSSFDKQPYQILFNNSTYIRDTAILCYVSFCGHLFYYMLTINFGYMKNLAVEANFIISGAGEWISVIIGAGLLRFFSRKTCMSIFLFFLASSFAFQSLVDSGMAKSLDTTVIVTTNNGVGTLSALLLVFVTLIVNQEVYPTMIRQTGSSIVNTLGESGSTIAPLLIQIGHRLVGIWKMDLFYAIICSIGIVGIQFITKTDDIELLDN